jgi:tetratricopeptide (TPR) repeat protein
MGKFLSEIFDNITSSLFKGAIFKEYHELYDKGAYKEAYNVFRDIVNKHPKWSKKGDPYVTFAKLELFANNDNEAAMKLLDKAKELGCKQMSSYYGVLGLAFWRKGNIEKGIQNYQKCVELEPTITNLQSLGNLLSNESDKRALDVWERILKKDPNNAVAHAYLGLEASRAGNHEQAVILADKADKFAHSKNDFLMIGRMYFRERQFKKALQYYLKCEELDVKTHHILYDEISLCYSILKDFPLAIIYAGKALDVHSDHEHTKIVLLELTEKQTKVPNIHEIVSKHPDMSLSYILLAQEAYNNDDFPKADKYLSKAIELKPSHVEMYNIARIYHFIENYEKAINYYLECEKLGYQYPNNLYGSIANCYFALKDEEAAIKYARKALGLDFNDDYVKDMLLDYVIINETVADFDKLVEIKPHSSFAYIIYAFESLKQMDKSEALKLAEKAQQLNPSLIEKFYIAWLFIELEDFQRALEILHECELSGFKDKSRLYQSFAGCYYELRQYEEAINYAEKVLSINPEN